MRDETASAITGLLKKHFDTKKLWMFDQFFHVYEKNILMQGFELELTFLDFLTNEGIKEILFFPEPGFDTMNIGIKKLAVEDIPDFLRLYAPVWTNNHLASEDLTWIFTLSHMGDYLLSGPETFVKTVLTYLRDTGAKESGGGTAGET